MLVKKQHHSHKNFFAQASKNLGRKNVRVSADRTVHLPFERLRNRLSSNLYYDYLVSIIEKAVTEYKAHKEAAKLCSKDADLQ